MPSTSDRAHWQDEPPDDKGSYIPIYSAKAGAAYEVVLLGGKMVGVWTHYVRERTVPCVKGSGVDCVCEREDCARRWKGYLCAWEPMYGRRCMIEVTADALHCANFRHDEVPQLRGRFVRITRRGRARNAPVVVSVTQASSDCKDLPEPFDLREALARVWRSQSRG